MTDEKPSVAPEEANTTRERPTTQGGRTTVTGGKTREILAELDRLRNMIVDLDDERTAEAVKPRSSEGGPPQDVAELLETIRRTVASPEALQSGYTMVFAVLESREGKERGSMVSVSSDTDLGKKHGPDDEIVAFASAFTNPGRLKIMRAVSHGSCTAAELAEETGLVGGQLYHHLKELVHGGFVLQEERGSYVLSPKIGKPAYLGMSLLAGTIARASERWGKGSQSIELMSDRN
ncbi:MAG: ArsR/SmtB family transcription factor [Bacillota bacterium]